MKYACLIILALLLNSCATSYVEVITEDGTKIRAVKNSTLRKGPYVVNVKMPIKGSKKEIEVTLAGNDEAMSNNLAITGAVIGGAANGPTGAAVGGIIGGAADILGKLKGYLSGETKKETPKVPTLEPPPPPPTTDKVSKYLEKKRNRVLLYSSKKPKRVLIYSSKNPKPIKPVVRKPVAIKTLIEEYESGPFEPYTSLLIAKGDNR